MGNITIFSAIEFITNNYYHLAVIAFILGSFITLKINKKTTARKLLTNGFISVGFLNVLIIGVFASFNPLMLTQSMPDLVGIHLLAHGFYASYVFFTNFK